MITLELKPFPGESEMSFTKRKAYYYRNLKHRFDGGKYTLQKKSKYSLPLTDQERKYLDDYWSQYMPAALRDQIINYKYYEFYKGIKPDGVELFRYIPDSFFMTFVDDYFTNPQLSSQCDDKNLYDLYFHDFNRPKVVFHKMNDVYLDVDYRPITQTEAVKKACNCGEVILKVAQFSWGSEGVLFWNNEIDDESKLLQYLQEHEQVVCQEILKQHSELNRLNASSINTIRLFTLVFHGEVHMLSSILRVGANNSRVDNASAGGIVCGIKPSGQLRAEARNYLGEPFPMHPNGTPFDSVTIPNYADCVELVKLLAARFSGISRLISWDIAINEHGHPVIIEFNLTWTGTDSLQVGNGPLLGDLTDEVLEEVFKNSYTLNSILKSI